MRFRLWNRGPRLRYFVPKVLGKLRWGYAAIFERVYEVDGYGPGRKTLASGVIMWITTNKNGDPLKHYPDEFAGQPTVVLFICYDDGTESWQPADAYLRLDDGLYPGRIVRVR